MTDERALMRASNVMIAPVEPEPRLDLGDLGTADGHPVRRGAVEFDHGAVAFLAHESDMRHRHDVAAVDANEQAGIELRFGFRNRPRAHPLAGAVMDPRVMGIGPDAPDIGGIDEMRAVGALDRKPGYRRRTRRLAEPAERRRRQPRGAGGRRG